MASNRIYLQVDLSSENAQANVNALNAAIAKTGPTAEKTSEQATKGMQKVSVSVESVSKSFSELSTALGGLGLAKIITTMVEMSSQFDRVQRAMVMFTGSSQTAGRVLEEIRKIAAESPFELKDLQQAARELLGFGVAAQQVPTQLKIITDQVAAFGGSIEDVNKIVAVFGRVLNKEFVGAMDLFRQFAAQGIHVMEALREAMSKELGRPISVEDVKQAIKNGILEPAQVTNLTLQQMAKQTRDFGKNLQDPAKAFKNLGDEIKLAVAGLGGPQGFGPALANLAKEIHDYLLVPLEAVIRYFQQLPEGTKELIVNLTALTVAVVAFGNAWKIAAAIAGPAIDAIKLAVGGLKEALIFAFANPELAAAIAGITLALGAIYLFVPQVREQVNQLAAGAWGFITEKVKELTKAAKEALGIGIQPIASGKLTKESEEGYKTLTELTKKHADEASQILLKAYASPAEAVMFKYQTLFSELEKKIIEFNISQEHQDQLRAQLTAAREDEIRAEQIKQRKQQLDEFERYWIEQVKGSADAQAAYIEAQDVQDLRGKVAAIDRITAIRIEAEDNIAKIRKGKLTQEQKEFEDFANEYRQQFTAAGIDVNKMIAEHREKTDREVALAELKAFDEQQKYRLEGWKKANDLIIEDQKRIYQSFRDIFDQVFDAFTDKTKSLGQAIGDLFKKLALGEIKETFSSMMAGMATEAAGYGRPEEAMPAHGRGLLGILLRRGMPPRPPMAPPEELGGIPGFDVSRVKSTGDIIQNIGSANREAADSNLASSKVQLIATQQFVDAVNQFQTAVAQMSIAGAPEYVEEMRHPGTVGTTREFWRYLQQPQVMPVPPTTETLINQATAKYGLPPNLLRAVAQVESGFNPRAVSPAGALGMLQLMPGTAAGLGVTQPFSSAQSIDAGARYLKQLLDRFGGNIPLALAAYNAGPNRAALRAGNVPSYATGYVAQVQGLMQQMQGQAPPSGLGAPVAAPPTLEQLAALPLKREYQSLLLPPMPTAVTTPEAVPTAAPVTAAPGLFSRLWRMVGAPTFPQGDVLTTLAASGVAPYVRGGTPGAESLARAAAIAGPVSPLRQLTALLGIGMGAGGRTTLGSLLTSRAAGAVAGLAGMAILSRGLQQRYAPATVVGGGLAGVGTVLSSPQLMARMAAGPGGLAAGLGAGAAAGAGLGLFAAGFQRGGGAGLAMDIGGGALAGAGIGFMVGGPLGAAIGAGIGAVAGGITGIVRLFVHTEQEKIRSQIKQVYGIDIPNRKILTQIQQIVDQRYGGNVAIGVRSQEVQDIVRLFALTTGQAAKLPRPMYAATFAQSAAGGLALQPVYQGGVQVQNPYTGTTTYQVQQALTQPNVFLQLNPQQANDLFTGRVVQAVHQNPAAVSSANAAGTRAGDSRLTQAGNMMEPLTALS